MIHVEGMGVLGSLVAEWLASRDVDFTWSDTDAPVTAWKASTGAVFPASDERSRAGLMKWRWILQCGLFGDAVEAADYWYCSVHPPHGVKKFTPEFEVPVQLPHYQGSLKLHAQSSVHVNVQRLVQRVRARYAHKRRAEPHPDYRVVVAHGFGARLRRYVWGWTRPVRLLGVEALPSRGGQRPAIYLRKGRVIMAYAYPIPGTALWYAGSSLIPQAKARSLDMQPKYERWQRLFETMSGLRVEPAGELVEGWRPSTGPVSDEEFEPLVQWLDGKLVVMPLWHSGVRWAPLVADAVVGEVFGEAVQTDLGCRVGARGAEAVDHDVHGEARGSDEPDVR